MLNLSIKIVNLSDIFPQKFLKNASTGHEKITKFARMSQKLIDVSNQKSPEKC